MLFDIDRDNGLVGRASGDLLDLDITKVAEVSNSLLRAPKLGGVECVSLNQSEFAPNDLVDRPYVSGDINAFHEHSRPFIDAEFQTDGSVFSVAIDLWPDIDKCESQIADLIGQFVDDFLDEATVVPVTLLKFDESPAAYHRQGPATRN